MVPRSRLVPLIPVLIAGLAGCGGDSSRVTPAPVVGAVQGPSQRIRYFAGEERREGLVVWKLAAAEADVFPDRKVTEVADPKIVFYKKGKAVSRLTAKRGRVMDETRDLEAEGSVVVVSLERDERVLTERLKWSNSAAKISSDAAVKQVTPDRVVTGIGFECDPDLTRLDILKDAKAEGKK